MVNLAEKAWQRLHELRLRGMVQVPEDEHTAALVEAGFVARRGTATLITPAGRTAHAEWARIPPGSEKEALVRRAYEQFLLVDRELKRLTTAWQMASVDVRPVGYGAEDWKLIDQLIALDEKVAPLVFRLGETMPRLAAYKDRLEDALQRVEQGERRWWSGVTCDSYHHVWWQLHEELLIALGISRSEDPNQ
jgi:pyruvate, orthophosphate dikinase